MTEPQSPTDCQPTSEAQPSPPGIIALARLLGRQAAREWWDSLKPETEAPVADSASPKTAPESGT